MRSYFKQTCQAVRCNTTTNTNRPIVCACDQEATGEEEIHAGQPAGVFGGVKGRMMRHVAGRVSDSLQIESASGTGCEGV